MKIDNEFNILSETVVREIVPKFIGPKVVSRANYVPIGASELTIVEEEYVDDEAKVGNEGAPLPRSMGKLAKKKIPILEHSHGFRIYERDLEASQNGIMPLPISSAISSALKVAESIENMIFNGLPDYDVKGIYKEAGKNYTVTKDKEWNTANGNPYNDINKAVGVLEETSSFEPDFMVLSPEAYTTLTEANNYGISPMKLIKDAGFFANGERIFKAPKRASRSRDPIIPKNGALIGAFGKNIAERYPQIVPNSGANVSQDPGYTEIFLQTKNDSNEDGNWFFNVKSIQGFHMHRLDAFVRLENLIKE